MSLVLRQQPSPPATNRTGKGREMRLHRQERSARRSRYAGITAVLIAAIAMGGCGSSAGSSSGGSSSNAGATTSGSPASGAGSSGSADAKGGVQAAPVIAKTSSTDWCGSKPFVLGLAAGNGANSWDNLVYTEQVTTAKQCPNLQKIIHVTAQGSAQTAISQLNSLVNQGANAIAILPNAGAPAAMLPAIRKATQAGAKVVPATDYVGGNPGQDYVTTVMWTPGYSGKQMAKWMIKALHGSGNVVFLGGPPGATTSQAMLDGITSTLKRHPGVKLLTKQYVVTNWDPAKAQQATAGLLSKYPKIDGVLSDSSQGAMGALRAFQAANRKLPSIAGLEENDLACSWKQLHGANPSFNLATVASDNFLGAVAVRKAVAAYEGVKETEPDLWNFPLYEDSLVKGMTPVCSQTLPPTGVTSSLLTLRQIKQRYALGMKANG